MTLFKARVRLTGLHAGSFAARLGRERIPVWNVKTGESSLSFLCAARDKNRVWALALERGYQVVGPAPVALYALVKTLRGRLALLAGIAALAVLVTLAMTRVWSIKIVDAGEYMGEIRLALNENGIYALMPRAQVKLNALRDALEWRLPKVKWVQVYYRGVTLVVRVVSGTSAGEAITYQGAGDVVAAQDGVVKSVITFAGTALVRPGEIVRKGQVLIQGVERGEKEEQIPVKARGSVKARVFLQASVQMPQTELVSEKTGRSARRSGAACPWLSLFFKPAPDYLTYDLYVETRPLVGAFLPVWLVREKYDEVSLENQMRSSDAVKREAGVLAVRKLNLAVGFADEVIDKWVDYSMIEGDLIEAKATAEILREIGRYRKTGS